MVVGISLAIFLWLTMSTGFGTIQMIAGVPLVVAIAYLVNPRHDPVEALKTAILVVLNFPKALAQAIRLLASSTHDEEYYLEKLEGEIPWKVFDRVILITFLPESIAINKEEEGILLCHRLEVKGWKR